MSALGAALSFEMVVSTSRTTVVEESQFIVVVHFLVAAFCRATRQAAGRQLRCGLRYHRGTVV